MSADAWRVPEAAVAASPLRGRLVALLDGAEAPPLPGPVVRRETGQLRALAHLLWAYRNATDQGLVTLADAPTFLAATRRLADAAYDVPLAAGRAFAVEGVAAADEEALAALYPDALVVRACAPPPRIPDPDPPAEPPRERGTWVRTGAGAWSTRLVVVLGVARSGTTWLEQLLLAHPRAGGVERTETFVFAALRPYLEQVAPTVGLLPVRTWCDELFRAALARHKPGADVFVEKTPLHTRMVPAIARLYPDACFVHLIRDGRDVASSLAESDLFDPPADVSAAAALWDEVVREVRGHGRGLERYRELRYEELLVDPVGVTTDLLAWVGLEAGAPVRAEIARRAGERVSVHGTTGPVGSGKWERLAPDALQRVLAACGPLLVELGYLDDGELPRRRMRPPRRRSHDRRTR